MKKIYLDNAATTAVSKDVFEAMKPYFLKDYGNASQNHFAGLSASKAIEKSRKIIGNFLGIKNPTNEIVFTSCSTESINLAHKGLLEGLSMIINGPLHVITTPIEHKAVLESLKHTGAEITILPVDKYGMVNVSDIEEAIKPNTHLVSIMYANNEIGTIQPIAQIGKMLQRYYRENGKKIYFHTDATQAIQYLNCDVDKLGVDLLSFTGHKIHAPKGIGGLYIRDYTPIVRQQDGGGQEFGFRAGTENVPYIVGLGRAFEVIGKDHEYVRNLTQILIESILQIPDSKLTGHPTKRLPHIASFVFKDVFGDDLVSELSNMGIAAASGSACNADNLETSHVLRAIGIDSEWAMGQLRFSLSNENTLKDVEFAGKYVKYILEKFRSI